MSEDREQPDDILSIVREHISSLAEERVRLLDETIKRIEGRIDEVARLSEERDRSQKELLQADIATTAKALALARFELERRLEGLNELRKEVTQDRQQFVKLDVYTPAHEALRIQRVADNEKAILLGQQAQANSTEIARMQSSLMWLTRLILGALILLLIGYAFQKVTGR